MAQRTPLMAGNWKMNMDHLEATHLVQKLAWALRDAKFDYQQVEVVVAPPFTALRSVQTLLDGDKLDIKLGAQDVSAHESGAYTGEIAAPMLARLDVNYVVVGHSERREYHEESDTLVGEKAVAALGQGMTPIICVGEGLDVRQAGDHVAYVTEQVSKVIEAMGDSATKDIVIAYEPVWAIGTGEVATPEDAQEVCAAVRERLSELTSAEHASATRVLYGGSVKSKNVAAIMEQADVDGALVGGASLDAEEFAAICRFNDHIG